MEPEKEKEIQKQLVLMVTRQTEYSFEEAEQKLLEHNNDYIKVIKESMNIIPKEKEKKTTNQQIYTEIRGLMDAAASNHRNIQEQNLQNK